MPGGHPHHHDPQALMRILEVARQLATPFALRDLLAQILDAGRDVLRADRGSVFLYDPVPRELYTVVATGVQEMRFTIDKGLAGACARTGQIVNVSDCYADPRFNPDIDRTTGYRTHCLLAVPLIGLDEELVGVLQLLNAASGGFDAADERLAVLLASQAATAIQRVRLLADRVERLKLERELALARQIQLGVLPKTLPACPGYAFATCSHPAAQTGGDIYDVVRLADLQPTAADPSPLFLLLADATGHGVGPALSITQVRAMLRIGLRLNAGLDALFRHINRQLTADLAADRFVTAFLGILDPQTHRVTYHAAGQAPLLHFHAATQQCEFLDATTIPLGILDAPPLDNAPPMLLQPGDWLVLLTDGLYEYQNAAAEPFGQDRVGAVVARFHAHPPQRVLEEILTALRTFAQGAPQCDDITALIVKRTA